MNRINFEPRPLRGSLLKQGILLLDPMYEKRGHFSAYLIERAFYSSIRDRIKEKVEERLRRLFPPGYEKDFSYHQATRLTERIEGLGEPRIDLQKGRAYLTLPHYYLLLTRGFSQLESEHLTVMREEKRSISLDSIKEKASLVDTTRGGSRLFVTVKGALESGSEEQIRHLIDEEATRLSGKLQQLIAELRTEGMS